MTEKERKKNNNNRKKDKKRLLYVNSEVISRIIAEPFKKGENIINKMFNPHRGLCRSK